MNITNTKMYTVCGSVEEILIYLFWNCPKVKTRITFIREKIVSLNKNTDYIKSTCFILGIDQKCKDSEKFTIFIVRG